MSTKNTVILDKPLTRGTQTITEVAVRKPDAGELRGCSLLELMRMDVTTLETVLPRITAPTLTAQDVRSLDPADLLEFGTTVTNFLLKKHEQPDSYPAESKTPPQTLE